MYFDVLMPAILFFVTLTAMFLGRKAESKLKATVEQREFKTRDTIIMVAIIAVAVSIVMFVPSMAIMAHFPFQLLFVVVHGFLRVLRHENESDDTLHSWFYVGKHHRRRSWIFWLNSRGSEGFRHIVVCLFCDAGILSVNIRQDKSNC